jgi:serine protease inhibitor
MQSVLMAARIGLKSVARENRECRRRMDEIQPGARRFGMRRAKQIVRRRASSELTSVKLALQKFKTSFDVSLVESFQKAGMKLALSDLADFSGMTEQGNHFKIGDIRYKAIINVAGTA